MTQCYTRYIYVFVANESENTEVWCDDFKVTNTRSNVISGGDYYPFGLAMETRQVDVESYRYGYQGQFSEESDALGTNQFELRFYDAKIGRWLSRDPYGQYHSPYLAMGNTPHMSVDPDGGWNWYTAGIGFVAGAGIGYAATGDWKGALIGGVAGGTLGGVLFDYSPTKTAYSSQVGSHFSPRGVPYATLSKFSYSVVDFFGANAGRYSLIAAKQIVLRAATEENLTRGVFEGEVPNADVVTARTGDVDIRSGPLNRYEQIQFKEAAQSLKGAYDDATITTTPGPVATKVQLQVTNEDMYRDARSIINIHGLRVRGAFEPKVDVELKYEGVKAKRAKKLKMKLRSEGYYVRKRLAD